MDSIPREILVYVLWLADNVHTSEVCKTFLTASTCKKSNITATPNMSLAYYQGVQEYSLYIRGDLPSGDVIMMIEHNAFKIYIDDNDKFSMTYMKNTFPCDTSYYMLANGRVRFLITYDHTRTLLSATDDRILFYMSDNAINKNINVRDNKIYFGYNGGKAFGRNDNNIQVGPYRLC